MSAPNAATASLRISVVIPTFRRGAIALQSVHDLRALADAPDEIVLVDQTPAAEVDSEIERGLLALASAAACPVRWLRLPSPSIPGAMNRGLLEALHDIVLYLDDDIRPHADLIAAHRVAQGRDGVAIVVGRVLQPWDDEEGPDDPAVFRFAQRRSQWVETFMGGNVSFKRKVLRSVGAFDERFVGAAYCFEAETAARLRRAGHRIWFAGDAQIWHLRAGSGGTRAHGHHLRTIRPTHTVGAYYYLLRSRPRGWWGQLLLRPFRAIRTRHHLRRPWWIPLTLIAEARGFFAALGHAVRSPRLLSSQARESAP